VPPVPLAVKTCPDVPSVDGFVIFWSSPDLAVVSFILTTVLFGSFIEETSAIKPYLLIMNFL
jgi:hypothetical protein